MSKQLIPMSINRLFSLKPGEKFVVDWSKDGIYKRLDYVTQTIVENDGQQILVDDPDYEWNRDEQIDENSNQLDTSRGIAYFYEAEIC